MGAVAHVLRRRFLFTSLPMSGFLRFKLYQMLINELMVLSKPGCTVGRLNRIKRGC